MRRLTVLAAAALALAACGGGESEAVDDEADRAPTVAPTTTVVVPLAPDRCETEPDPADYLDGPAPTAIRPCEIPTELTVKTIRDGVGSPAEAGDGIIYHYVRIRSVDGALIDSSYATGSPANLPVVGRGSDIAGLDTGLIGVRAGQLLRLDVPADQAYGDTPPDDVEGIRAGDALTYMVDVQGVIPLSVPEDAPLDLEIEPSVGALEVTTVDLTEGAGRPAEIGTTVVMNVLLVRGDNSVVIFNSWDQRSPLAIRLDPALMAGPEPATLPGIFEGIQGATPGTRRIITMPPEEAWGPEGQPQLGLPGGTDVVVVADVLAVY